MVVYTVCPLGKSAEVSFFTGTGLILLRFFSSMHHSFVLFDHQSLRLETKRWEGGQAQVFYAELGEQREPVAVKIFRPEFLLSYQQERAVLAQSEHVSIPKLRGIIEDYRGIGLVLDYVVGCTLFDILNTAKRLKKPISIIQVCNTAWALFSVLAYVHTGMRQAVIHADISPDNIVITPSGTLTLLDFAGSVFCRDMKGARKTFGKAGYLAPELLHGGLVSFQADLFALAAVIFEMLTLDKFDVGNMRLHQLDQVKHHDPQLSLILKACLAPSPHLRPQHAGEIERFCK